MSDTVANAANGIALPKYEGKQGIAMDEMPDPKLPLPQLLQAKPDPGMHMDISGNRLIVKLDKPVFIMFLSENFLTHWWINGLPFVPKSDRPVHRNNGGNWDGVVPRVSKFRLDLEFHPEYFDGLKKGDTVGLQLLICPDGWESYGPAEPGIDMVEPLCNAKAQDIYISRMSNKVEFIYTGDPANFAENKPAKPGSQ